MKKILKHNFIQSNNNNQQRYCELLYSYTRSRSDNLVHFGTVCLNSSERHQHIVYSKKKTIESIKTTEI